MDTRLTQARGRVLSHLKVCRALLVLQAQAAPSCRLCTPAPAPAPLSGVRTYPTAQEVQEDALRVRAADYAVLLATQDPCAALQVPWTRVSAFLCLPDLPEDTETFLREVLTRCQPSRPFCLSLDAGVLAAGVQAEDRILGREAPP